MNSKLENWEIKEDYYNINYCRAKEWSIQNGYHLRNDVSYNGFITIEKKFCLTTDPSDGHSLEIQVRAYPSEVKHHSYQQSDIEADFGNIMDETKYRLKYSHSVGHSYSSMDLEEVLNKALEREKQLTDEFINTNKANNMKRPYKYFILCNKTKQVVRETNLPPRLSDIQTWESIGEAEWPKRLTTTKTAYEDTRYQAKLRLFNYLKSKNKLC